MPDFYPANSTLLEGILRDSAYEFLDDINTPEKETLKHDVNLAFKKAVLTCKNLDREGKLTWAKMKATRIEHLAKLDAFSRLDIDNGGGEYAINAVKKDHGPSWRMIVQLTKIQKHTASIPADKVVIREASIMIILSTIGQMGNIILYG